MRKKIAFNVGASIGNSLDSLSGYDVVYAFEPNPFCFQKLVEHKNNRDNIHVYQLAISEENGYAHLNCHHHYEYSSLLQMVKDGEFYKRCSEIDPGFNFVQHSVQVTTKRLDTFIKENNIPYIDFLKIDTQGHDLSVVKSLGTFIKNVNMIELEVQNKPLYYGSSTKEHIISYLKNKGFSLVDETWNSELTVEYEQRLTFKLNDDDTSNRNGSSCQYQMG